MAHSGALTHRAAGKALLAALGIHSLPGVARGYAEHSGDMRDVRCADPIRFSLEERNLQVDQSDRASLTRRQWLSRVPAPLIAASLGVSVLGEQNLAAKTAESTATTNDLGARVYNIRDYGAKGDGAALDTAALQMAIDACTRDGGGTVLVPAGTFQIGTVELKSNVTLHIAAAGKLLGSSDGRQYHAVDAIPLFGDTTLDDGNWALLFAVNAKKVTIEGPGAIDGQGHLFRSVIHGAQWNWRAPAAVSHSLLPLRRLHGTRSLSAGLRLSQCSRDPERPCPHGSYLHPQPCHR